MLRKISLIRSMSVNENMIFYNYKVQMSLKKRTSKWFDRQRVVVSLPVQVVPSLPGQRLVAPAVSDVGNQQVVLVVGEVAHLNNQCHNVTAP